MSSQMSQFKTKTTFAEPSPVGRLKFINNVNDPIYSRMLENQLTIEKSIIYKRRKVLKKEISEETKQKIKDEVKNEIYKDNQTRK